MKLGYFSVFLSIMIGCSSHEQYQPNGHLSPQEQDKIVTLIIRYVGKQPDKANDSTKFLSQYDEHYLDQAAKHKLTLYYRSDDEQHFFLMTRKAPSIHEKYVATGGKFRLNEADSLIEYEEVFRTWKMVSDTLTKRSLILFDKMVKGESLDEFLTKNSKGIEYIEFPDDHVVYDKVNRKWKSALYQSVEELVGAEK